MRNITNNIKIEAKSKNIKFKQELLESTKESNVILKEIKKGKRTGYNNMSDLIDNLNK